MGKCKACGAEIIQINTVAGKSMPCDADLTTYWEKLGAKNKIVTPNGEVFSCEYEGLSEKATGIGYKPHWGSCPSYKRKGER